MANFLIRCGVDSDFLPVMLPEPGGRDYFNHRRRNDPLGTQHIESWCSRIITVVAVIAVSVRLQLIVVKNSGTRPQLADFQRVRDAI